LFCSKLKKLVEDALVGVSDDVDEEENNIKTTQQKLALCRTNISKIEENLNEEKANLRV
jgi:hypothetical protein